MIFAGLRPILGEAYAALRRQLLVDPHVLKDGSRSPDLVMDNPLSQSPLQMKAYMLEVIAHTEPCRALCFVNEAIITGSPEYSILATDVETGVQIGEFSWGYGIPDNVLVATILVFVRNIFRI
ncbi:hypothetical protein OROMI_008163 [Orobanche minor]